MPTLRERVWNRIAPPTVRQEMEALRADVRALAEAVEFYEEPGWWQLGGESLSGDVAPINRLTALLNSRYYWHRDPLYGRAVRLTRNYTFGRGVSWRAGDPKIAEVLERFWDDPDNRLFTRAEGQWELCDKLIVDGELFPVFFVNRYDGAVKVSLVEPEEVSQVIPDPDDRRKTRYYERQWVRYAWNWESKSFGGGEARVDYYPDWGCRETRPGDSQIAAERLVAGDDPGGAAHATVAVTNDVGEVLTHVYMSHLRANRYGLRALPAFYAAITWVSGYKGFMEDRATLTLAAATFAFKQKIKGGAQAVARLVSQWGGKVLGRYGGSGGRERREGAQTIIENEASDLQQLHFDTRAGNAYQDGRMLRQQVSAGTDVTEPDLTGDPSVGNLASMTAMNGPQLKGFESWQQLFKDLYQDVFDFVIRMAVIYGGLDLKDERGQKRDLTVEVDFPPIVVKDLPVLIGAVAALISAQSLAGREYVSPKRLAAYILQAFGETDVEEALAELDFEDVKRAVGDFADEQALPDEHADAIQAAIEALRVAVGENGR